MNCFKKNRTFNKKAIIMNNISEEVKNKNLKIINQFYKANQIFITKKDLLSQGFDFSEWFSTSNLKHYFDNEENSFEYTDFKCGNYYIKTGDKNPNKTELNERIFFQIIKVNFERIEAELKRTLKLLHERKFASGTAWAYRGDMEMRDLDLADKFDEKLKSINSDIETTLPHLRELINSLANTHNVFVDLVERLENVNTEDERWV